MAKYFLHPCFSTFTASRSRPYPAVPSGLTPTTPIATQSSPSPLVHGPLRGKAPFICLAQANSLRNRPLLFCCAGGLPSTNDMLTAMRRCSPATLWELGPSVGLSGLDGHSTIPEKVPRYRPRARRYQLGGCRPAATQRARTRTTWLRFILSDSTVAFPLSVSPTMTVPSTVQSK